MKDCGWMQPIVERVVGQVLDSHAAQLRSEIVRRVMEEMEAQPATPASASDAGSADLARAVAEIQLGSSQREILSALLDTCSRYAARVALFVVKGSQASGWQGRGFAKNDRLKDFALDTNASAVARAIHDRVTVNAPSSEADSGFLEEFGTPASGEIRFLPLVLKEKVAALIYADAGTDDAGKLDAGSLELLVLTAGAWLEVNSLRKQAHKEPAAVPSESAPAAAPQPSPGYNDPFASHASGQARAAVAAAESSAPATAMIAPVAAEAQHAATENQSAVAEAEVPATDPLPLTQPEAAPTSEPPPAPTSAVSLEDQDVHRKAQRFARLLVDEIKLYNQARVAEGRKNKDLYDRLHEAIEKSRATYQKRYGNTVAASVNYFQDEVVRSLAEDDISVMGANFQR
jgi:hypothetical protein